MAYGAHSKPLQPLGALAPRPGSEEWPLDALAPLAGRLDESLSEKVADYLAGSPNFLAWMEHTRDVIGDTFGVSGGSSILSDGVFYWRLDAADYVRAYRIEVPTGAIQNMEANRWTPPDFSREEYNGIFASLMRLLHPSTEL